MKSCSAYMPVYKEAVAIFCLVKFPRLCIHVFSNHALCLLIYTLAVFLCNILHGNQLRPISGMKITFLIPAEICQATEQLGRPSA